MAITSRLPQVLQIECRCYPFDIIIEYGIRHVSYRAVFDHGFATRVTV